MSKLTPNRAFIKNNDYIIRKRWADALVNSPTPQARGRMISAVANSRCCLMVGHDEWGGTCDQRTESVPLRHSPFAVAFNATDPIIATTNSGRTVFSSAANDVHKYTLKQIAALVCPEDYSEYL